MSSIPALATHALQILRCFTLAKVLAALTCVLCDGALTRRPVYEINSGADQHDCAHERGAQRLVQDDDAGGDTEQRSQKCEHRQARGEITRKQPEPGEVAREGHDHSLIEQRAKNQRRDL